MTDAELKAWLRGMNGSYAECDLAADRIKALIAERIAAEDKLAKAVKVLTKIAKYDHQAAAMRVLSLKDEQPFAMHLAPTPHPTKDRDTAVLLRDVASTDIAGWAAVTLAEIKGENHE